MTSTSGGAAFTIKVENLDDAYKALDRASEGVYGIDRHARRESNSFLRAEMKAFGLQMAERYVMPALASSGGKGPALAGATTSKSDRMMVIKVGSKNPQWSTPQQRGGPSAAPSKREHRYPAHPPRALWRRRYGNARAKGQIAWGHERGFGASGGPRAGTGTVAAVLPIIQREAEPVIIDLVRMTLRQALANSKTWRAV